MDEDTNMTEMETSADMIMPLPLTEEQIDNLTEENYRTEFDLISIGQILILQLFLLYQVLQSFLIFVF